MYDIQQQTKNLHNPAFILILRSLQLVEQLVMNKYAKVAVQSMNKERAQQKQRSRDSTNSPSTHTAPLSPTSSGSKSIKRSIIRRAVAGSYRERAAQKPKENKEQQRKKTPNRTKRPITIQILQRQGRRRQKQNMAR